MVYENSLYTDLFMIMFAVRELDVPGEIYERKTYPFEFSTVEMPYETYNGVNVRLRYVNILKHHCYPEGGF